METKINRVLLITPPAVSSKSFFDVNPLPPLGLGYLASVAEDMGIKVNILDALVLGWKKQNEIDEHLIRIGLSNTEIADYLSAHNPHMVGVSCQFSRQYRIYHEMFSLIKGIDPEIITIGGGPHITVCPEEALNDPNCDFIIMGEAEESFRDLLRYLKQGGGLDKIDGLGWKRDGKINLNEKKKWIDDLDSILFPAYHLMDLNNYFDLDFSHGQRHKYKFCPIITSRGCPAKCTFCSANKVWGKKYRMRSVDNILKEMRLLKEQYGIEEIMFEDDNVTADAKRARQLFSRMIEEDFNFVWDTPNGVGVWTLDTELIDIMQKSGCVKLHFPVESGSQEVLSHIIKKPLKLSKVRELIEHCRKIHLDYSMFLVIGMPGEKIEDIWKSIRFAADCGCFEPLISVATPYPGTDLYKTCAEKNFFSEKFSLDHLYIRSFLIQTPDWDEAILREVLDKAQTYLLIRKIIAHPLELFKIVLRLCRKPGRIFSHIRRILSLLLFKAGHTLTKS